MDDASDRPAGIPDALRDELRAAWHRYLDLLAPLRPDLQRYCRHLTGSVWDAEDLAQDTLVRAFATLGNVHHPIREPRAYLLRVATNAWIDTVRRRRSEGDAIAGRDAEAADPEPGTVRDAGAVLLTRLAPQERAAVVLKESFDLSLEEIAATIGTTVGAVKAALHRGRTRLREPAESRRARAAVASPALVDGFVAAWRAGDLPALLALLIEDAAVENVGCGIELGREAGGKGFLYKAVHGHEEWPAAFQPEAVRLDRGAVEGEPVVLCFATRGGREALEQVLRFDEVDGRVARLRGYAFCPETMREIGAGLGVPVRTGLYRFPTPAPGKYWE